ncbi:hypothetical protein BKA67DRAFT_659653 [Truncatella angustata]|uniref:N-acetyltransferase ESCO zinc-finger domain-containing protein n=1 Tax=Truncatella angustata TaxID=152316 RepID=A0A9P8UIW5_9PEZI|nr:uncharacterized protein BKA67DRAFT_659653 [Truncatella angustata]KAH6653004.1 hypothetical protein BKA67DRAFT_659653 [Truncatella angustata]
MERVSLGLRGVNKPSIRTYGKRATPAGSVEPPTKRRRAESSHVNIHSIAGRFAPKTGTAAQTADSLDSQLPSALPPQQPKKGTILGYFKVRSPSSETLSPCAQSSEPVLPSPTPPSSPPALERARKQRRRLTTKPALCTDQSTKDGRGEDESDHNDAGHTPKEDEDEDEDEAQNHTVLTDTTTSSLNRKPSREPDRSDAGKRGASKKQKPQRASVQTTLSLSLTEKQFVECTECNMLYNPYHEKDVKMHKKRHAALLKSK